MAFEICPAECVLFPPNFADNGCDTTFRSGGVSNFVIASCDVPELSNLSIAQICEYIQQGKIVISPELGGEIAEPETTTVDDTSCRPDSISGYTWNLAFTAYPADNVNFTDYDFWNGLKRDYRRYKFGFLTCEGFFVGWIPRVTFSAGNVRPRKSTESSYWAGSLSWLGFEDYAPQRISGLVEALNGGCVDGPTGFSIDVEFLEDVSIVQGAGLAVLTNELEITRDTCTEDIVITIEDIAVITGGPTPPEFTVANIAGPADTTGGSISADATNASAGLYVLTYTISACDDSYTRTLEVTVTPAP